MTSPSSAAARQWKLQQNIWSLVANKRGDRLCGALSDGGVVVLPSDDAGEDPCVIEAHAGVSLEICADADDHAFLSGGDDGQLLLIDPQIPVPTVLATQTGKWIDHVAASPEGFRAYASGKMLYRLDEEGKEAAPPLALPSSIGALAFSPNGKRLAVAHYGGVSLLWTHAPDTAPDVLPWKGSHVGLLWKGDGDLLLSSLQDGALHGWQLENGIAVPQDKGREMHMQGYETKIASMAFSAPPKPYLVTSGAQQAVCWPFHDGGPWEKQPLMLGGIEARLVTRAQPHPRDPMAAVGYDDGMVILAPFDGRMEIMIHPPSGKDAGVTGMVWDKDGQTLIVAQENGTLLLFTLASISRFVRGRFG